eukprot:733209-Rhodomonas_salina.8
MYSTLGTGPYDALSVQHQPSSLASRAGTTIPYLSTAHVCTTIPYFSTAHRTLVPLYLLSQYQAFRYHDTPSQYRAGRCVLEAAKRTTLTPDIA